MSYTLKITKSPNFILALFTTYTVCILYCGKSICYKDLLLLLTSECSIVIKCLSKIYYCTFDGK